MAEGVCDRSNEDNITGTNKSSKCIYRCKNVFVYSLALCLLYVAQVNSQRNCRSIFVRWPRVKLNFGPAKQGPFSLSACKTACSTNQDPHKSGIDQQCSAFNHRAGPNQYTHECQIFQKDNVQYTDGYMEADDRYTFYWKYCVNTDRTCGGDFAFTFFSDRYMAESETVRTVYTKTLEDCLAECLNERQLFCRSVSFNRTDGGCHLSEQNQLSKPGHIKINNNPNFRVDYYENNCVNNSFTFNYRCEDKGIQIDVDSKLPYTGALYGLYDFFSCRIEPKESKKFGYMFPYPTLSKNCSDSMRYSGTDVILEVVLSTDGVEPLYFITSDDLTYQAKCPVAKAASSDTQPTKEKDKTSRNTISFQDSSQSNSNVKDSQTSKSTYHHLNPKAEVRTLKPITKDLFNLPLYTTPPVSPSKTDFQQLFDVTFAPTQTINSQFFSTSTTSPTTSRPTTYSAASPATSSKKKHGLEAITDVSQLRSGTAKKKEKAVFGSVREVNLGEVAEHLARDPLQNGQENFSFNTKISFPDPSIIKVSTAPQSNRPTSNVEDGKGTDHWSSANSQSSSSSTSTTTTTSTTSSTTTPTTTATTITTSTTPTTTTTTSKPTALEPAGPNAAK
uniref:Apple domain-containing protein n=1 Tax=Ditylenchus dipsaci TaxID=166011 RepID=A0A915E186_9BILA